MTIDTFGADASSIVTTTGTIANGTAVTGTINAPGLHLIGIGMPAGWDTANITFQAVTDGGTAQNLYDSTGSEVTITSPAASRNIAVPPLTLGRAWTGIVVRSGTSATPVNQTAQRVLTLVFGRYS